MIARVHSIQRLAVETKLSKTTSFLIPSNSMGLNSGLLECSRMPRNSMAFRFRDLRVVLASKNPNPSSPVILDEPLRVDRIPEPDLRRIELPGIE